MNGKRAKELRRRTAELRFSIVGPLLASPPPRGRLWHAIEGEVRVETRLYDYIDLGLPRTA
jgi:hypothetical protein